MIPKIIHYCWFGGNPLPPLAVKCIESWRKFFPDYEIWQWTEEILDGSDNEDENNLFDKKFAFDVNIIPYTAEAYEMKKYAFVSDCARFWILYKYGGIYFDTDVEVIRSMDDIVERGAFMGCETDYQGSFVKSKINVNPGLGLGVAPGLGLIKKMLDYYEGKHFEFRPDIRSQITVVHIATEILCQNGLQNVAGLQCVDGVWIYPSEYFCPINVTTMRMHKTQNTRTIHRYAATWIGKPTFKSRLKIMLPEWMQLLISDVKRRLCK